MRIIKAVSLIIGLGLLLLESNAQEKQKAELIVPTHYLFSSAFNPNIAFSPDGKVLAITNFNEITVLEIVTGRQLRQLDAGSLTDSLDADAEESFQFKSVAFSPDGKMLAGTSRDEIILWDIITGKKQKTFKPLSEVSYPGSIAFSPDGKTLASEDDASIKIWDIATGKIKKEFKPKPDENTGNQVIDKIIISPNGKILISQQWERIDVWNLLTGKLLKSFIVNDEVDSDSISTIAISSDGKKLAIASYLTIKIVNLESGKEQKLASYNTRFNRKIIFSPDNGFLATTEGGRNKPDGSELEEEVENTVELLRVSDGEKLKTLRGYNSEVSAISISSDGKILATTSSFKEEGIIKLWEMPEGKELNVFRSNNSSVDLGTFSPDNKYLGAVSDEGKFYIWDLKNGELQYLLDRNTQKSQQIIKTLRLDLNRTIGRDDVVRTGRFPNGSISVTSGLDNSSIVLYESQTRKEIAKIITFVNGNWLIITPEGFFDGTPEAWKQLIWRFDNNTFNYAPVEAFFKEFYYPALLQEIMQGKAPTPPEKDLSEIDIRQPVVKITTIDGKPTNSAEKISADKQTVKIRVEIEDNSKEGRKPNFSASSGANDLRLFRNGSLVRLWKKKNEASDKTSSVFDLTKDDGCTQIAATKDAPRKAVCEVDVQIASGENNFTAYAFNHENVKSTDAPQVSVEGKFPKRDGTLYVLAIGVNKYKNTDYNLNYAVKDVQEIGTVLQAQQSKLGNLKQYSRTEIVALTDEAATKENILKALTLFSNGEKDAQFANLSEMVKTQLSKIKPAQPEDAVIIYFAGHGVSKGQRFYLLPHNFTGDAGLLEKESVSDLELNDYLEKVDAGRLLMVIDACQSGAALGGKNDGRAPMNSKGFAQLAYDKGMFILTAAQSQQAALEAVRIGDKTIENGLLTYTLLQAFSNKESDKDANSQLWETEWFDYAVSQVPLFQREAMRQREVELKTGNPQVKGRSGIFYVNGEDKKNADERGVQTPRVFYRREADVNPFILANQ